MANRIIDIGHFSKEWDLSRFFKVIRAHAELLSTGPKLIQILIIT
ncbi:MAG: hypothetical protein ACYTFW_22755 [Planctomycetota bacterium]|jgi:hypothetical protein